MLGYTTHHPPGQTPTRQIAHRQTPPPGQTSPQQTATAVDGTHPTGMHSCLMVKSNFFYKSCSSTLPHSAGQIVRSILFALQFKATLCVLNCGLFALFYDLGSVLNSNISNSNSSSSLKYEPYTVQNVLFTLYC